MISEIKIIARAKRWLVSNRLGKMLLVGLAPLIVTPDLFDHEEGKSKPIYVRFGYMPILTSASFLSWAMSKAIVYMVMKFTPNIDGMTGADYASSLSKIQLYSGMSAWVIAIAIISLCSAWAWGVHHFAAWIVKHIDIPVAPRPIAYFALMVSSAAFLFGAFGVVATFTLHTIDQSDIERIFQHLNLHPWQFLLCIGIIELIRRRRERVKRITAYQLYPNWWLRILIPMLTIFTPLVIPLIVLQFSSTI